MRLAATLGALVEGVAAGLMGHAVVIAPKDANWSEAERLAEATGADIRAATRDRAADWLAAGQQARGEWLLFLDAGDMLDDGWTMALKRHALVSVGRPGRVLHAGWRGLVEHGTCLFSPAVPASGVLLPRQALTFNEPLPRAVPLPLRRRKVG